MTDWLWMKTRHGEMWLMMALEPLIARGIKFFPWHYELRLVRAADCAIQCMALEVLGDV